MLRHKPAFGPMGHIWSKTNFVQLLKCVLTVSPEHKHTFSWSKFELDIVEFFVFISQTKHKINALTTSSSFLLQAEANHVSAETQQSIQKCTMCSRLTHNIGVNLGGVAIPRA